MRAPLAPPRLSEPRKVEAEAQAVYDRLYTEYVTLHDYFGRGENDVMKRLRAIRNEARGVE